MSPQLRVPSLPLAVDDEECGMGIGVGVLLIVVGAIIAFAIDEEIASIDSQALGWILILGGVLAIVLGFFMQAQKSRRTQVVEERRYDDRPPPPR